MSTSTVRVKFLGDTSQLERASKKASASVGQVEKSVKASSKLAAFAGITAGLGAATVALKSTITAGSDLSETISKTRVIFGTSADAILRWSQTTATAMGQSRQQALDAASTFATFGEAAGLSGGQLTKFATNLTGLSSDLASFYNTDPTEAIEAIGAALRGESEPIRKYGVLLNEATLRAEALKLGLIKTTKEALTPQQRVLAAQAAILAQTKKAQGDFARTADGAANKQRVLSAKVKDLQATLGQKLLPVYQKIVEVGVQVINFLQMNAEVFGPLAIAIGVAAVAMAAFNAVMAANPISLVVIAIAALIGGLIAAYKKFGWFHAAVDAVWQGIQAGWSALVTGFRAVWDNVGAPAFAVISKAISLYWNYYVKPVFLALKAGFEIAWRGISVVWDSVGRPIFDGIKAAVERIGPVFATVAETAGSAFRGIISVVRTVWNAIADAWNASIGKFSFTVPSWVPGIGGNGFDVPDLPRLAKGGIVTRPTVALIGEAGPEAVVPLGKGGGMGATIYLTVNTLDARTAGPIIVDHLRQWNRERGPLPVKVA